MLIVAPPLPLTRRTDAGGGRAAAARRLPGLRRWVRAHIQRSLCDDTAILPAAVLHGALLGVVVDPDDAEPLLIAPRPLEVVEQRPVEVAAHIDTGIDGVQDRTEVRA